MGHISQPNLYNGTRPPIGPCLSAERHRNSVMIRCVHQIRCHSVSAIYKSHSSAARVGRRAGAEPSRSGEPDRRQKLVLLPSSPSLLSEREVHSAGRSAQSVLRVNELAETAGTVLSCCFRAVNQTGSNERGESRAGDFKNAFRFQTERRFVEKYS